MKKTTRKLAAFGCAVLAAACVMAGCASTVEETAAVQEPQETSAEAETESAEEPGASEEESREETGTEAASSIEEAYQITGVDGSTVTAASGTYDEETGTFEASGDTIDFTVTENTSITVETDGDSQEGTEDDLTEGSLLQIYLDDAGQAEDITVLQGQ